MELSKLNESDAARRDRTIAENNNLRQEAAELRHFVRDLSQASVGDDLWAFVERAKVMMGSKNG